MLYTCNACHVPIRSNFASEKTEMTSSGNIGNTAIPFGQKHIGPIYPDYLAEGQGCLLPDQQQYIADCCNGVSARMRWRKNMPRRGLTVTDDPWYTAIAAKMALELIRMNFDSGLVREGTADEKAMQNLMPQPMPPPPPRKCIQIFTAGEKPYGCSWKPDWLWSQIELHHPNECPYVSSMFNCYKIERNGCAAHHHTGENAWNLHSTLQSCRFWEIVAEVNQAVDEWFDPQDMWPSDRPMNLLFFCKQGRHRSVAAARLCFAMLRSRDGYEVSDPVHLARWSWDQWICTECEDCRPNNHWKNQMLAEMFFSSN